MKKKIVASVLSLAMCASVITGATYALFTSESETNIAITSGKVDVSATIKNVSVYSPAGIYENGEIADDDCHADVVQKENGGVFANGGTVELDADSATLTLSKMIPGDKVNFDIEIVNDSNVTIQYRTLAYTETDNGLIDALNIKLGENDFDGSNLYSNWATLSVDVKTITVKCEVELPADAGNEYQDLDCSIAFAVKAVQGNTTTTDAVARIGEGYFKTIDEAIENVEVGETIEIIRPGTYAPFTIGVDNVTVKGIVGKTKAESTVIKNTPTSNVRAFANDITLDSLYIDDATPFVGSGEAWIQGGAVTSCINVGSGATGANLTVSNCHIVGNGAEGGFAILYCSSGLNFKGNTIENYNTGFSAMSDNNAVNSFTITGNKFVDVEYPINGYWGGSIGENYNGTIVITNNTVDEGTIVVWDYAQLSGNTGVSPVIKNNSGDITYCLVWFDYLTETDDEVVIDAKTQTIVYQSRVAFDIPYADRANYVITNTDGSALTAAQGNSTLTQNISVDTVAKAGVYALASGDYLLVDNTTGIKYLFTVTDPVVGEQQFIKLDTAYVYNQTQLETVLANGVKTIYLDGAFGATTLPHDADGLTLNGLNGATMDSLNVNGATNVVIDSITFDAAKAQTVCTNTVACTATNFTASIYENRNIAAGGAATVASENITVKNCVFEGEAVAEGTTGYTAINVNDGGAGTRSAGWKIEGCKFNCNAVSYIYIQEVRVNSAVVITGNTFGGEGYSTTWTAVAVQQLNGATVEITNNIFYSFNSTEGAIVISKKNSSQAANVVATVTGNEFNGALDDNACVICIRRTGTEHTVNGNTYNITGRSLSDSNISEGTELTSAVAVWYRS